jgi:hypothetical protein
VSDAYTARDRAISATHALCSVARPLSQSTRVSVPRNAGLTGPVLTTETSSRLAVNGYSRWILGKLNALGLKRAPERLLSSRQKRLASLKFAQRGGRNPRERRELPDSESEGSAGHPALGSVHLPRLACLRSQSDN